MPTREDALALLKRYNSNALVTHGLAVEGTMRYFAEKSGENKELWGIVGLLHDVDYERYPEEHCRKGAEILRENGYPEEVVRAMMSHGWGICTDVEPLSQMEKTLYAVDELTGLITACALVRPSKSVMDLELSSAKKKFKDKGFAAGASREVIQKGADMLHVSIDELIVDVISAMRAIAPSLGLEMKS
ncbi:MAG: HDIG domain-containing protein [Epsilonproteobacteria bacterium]|uniref:HDIG domain-containing metalloprotein n=1 Tax=Sulfurospirillum sp. MES TaxID=1565314 RepID=UPI00054284AF|nr:HDIG domain-containing metalloprotein [Sulfurospirillum sp. MES]KHG33057.1 MAG: hydrolase [Sulfurospirillum sp. MES]NCB54269.1 HDIG domain-containing protein [Campylobacterota bacterium]